MDTLKEEYKKERIALEKKYDALKEPFFTQRKQVVTGETAVEGGEARKWTTAIFLSIYPRLSPPHQFKDIIHKIILILAEGTPAGLSSFWLKAIANHPVISSGISADDLPVLALLKDITVTYNEEYTSFTLNFFFDTNPNFTNKVLSKTYVIAPDLINEDPNIADISGAEIAWNPNLNLCAKEIKKKVKAKSGKNKGQVNYLPRLSPLQLFLSLTLLFFRILLLP